MKTKLIALLLAISFSTLACSNRTSIRYQTAGAERPAKVAGTVTASDADTVTIENARTRETEVIQRADIQAYSLPGRGATTAGAAMLGGAGLFGIIGLLLMYHGSTTEASDGRFVKNESGGYSYKNGNSPETTFRFGALMSLASLGLGVGGAVLMVSGMNAHDEALQHWPDEAEAFDEHGLSLTVIY